MLQEIRQISDQSLDCMMARSCDLSESSRSFYGASKKSSGFFGGMKSALSGAVQSLGSSSSRERCATPVVEQKDKRSKAARPPVKSTPFAEPSAKPPAPAQAQAQAAAPAPEAPTTSEAPTTLEPSSQPKELTRPGQPEAAPTSSRDYTQVPKQLDEQFERLDPVTWLLTCSHRGA